jgi:hypothetical protein
MKITPAHHSHDRLKTFFDRLEIVNSRFPELHQLVFNVGLIVVAILGVYAFFAPHP